VGISTVVRLVAALALVLVGSGCFAGSSRECARDSDCVDAVCARTGECIDADSAIAVVLEWTVGGAPAADLETILYDGEEEATRYAPIPCPLGRSTYDKMPSRIDRIELFAYDDGGAVIDSGSAAVEPSGTTTVTIDLQL
jgi:hypothetical protein